MIWQHETVHLRIFIDLDRVDAFEIVKTMDPTRNKWILRIRSNGCNFEYALDQAVCESFATAYMVRAREIQEQTVYGTGEAWESQQDA